MLPKKWEDGIYEQFFRLVELVHDFWYNLERLKVLIFEEKVLDSVLPANLIAQSYHVGLKKELWNDNQDGKSSLIVTHILTS